MAKCKKMNQYNKRQSARMIFQKDTLMIQHHIDVSQLQRCYGGGALVQIGHRNVWVFIWTDHAVLKVQFILITRHRELWRNGGEKELLAD